MVFENGVKNIQAAAYNGARTVDYSCIWQRNSQKMLHKIHCYKISMSVNNKYPNNMST